jgi:hypothetical protein
MGAPSRYQKAGQIGFTTRCLAFVFGESWAPFERRCFWWAALTREWSAVCAAPRDDAPHKFAMSELSYEMRMMWFSVVVIRSSLIVFRRRKILLGSRHEREDA